MLAGLWLLRGGFTGTVDRFWWMLSFWIQFFHHIEHAILQTQAILGRESHGAPGTDEPRATPRAASRAASLLQHHRLHPDGHCDVLPPVSTRQRAEPTEVSVRIPRRGRPPVVSAGVSVIARRRVPWSVGALLLAVSLTAACMGHAATASSVDVTWMLAPARPVVGPATLTITLRRPSDGPVTGAAVTLEGHMSHPGMAPVLADATERAPGVYRSAIRVHDAGRLGAPRVRSAQRQDACRAAD